MYVHITIAFKYQYLMFLYLIIKPILLDFHKLLLNNIQIYLNYKCYFCKMVRFHVLEFLFHPKKFAWKEFSFGVNGDETCLHYYALEMRHNRDYINSSCGHLKRNQIPLYLTSKGCFFKVGGWTTKFSWGFTGEGMSRLKKNGFLKNRKFWWF